MILAALIAQAATVTLPYVWLEHCYHQHDQSCTVSAIEARDLIHVNKTVIAGISYVEDLDEFDPWTAFPADRKGDCGDHVVTVRAALLALGLPPSAMRVEIGEAPTKKGWVGHMVLVVSLEGKEWVVDMLTPQSVYPPNARPYDWRPRAMQSHDGVAWTAP